MPDENKSDSQESAPGKAPTAGRKSAADTVKDAGDKAADAARARVEDFVRKSADLALSKEVDKEPAKEASVKASSPPGAPPKLPPPVIIARPASPVLARIGVAVVMLVVIAAIVWATRIRGAL